MSLTSPDFIIGLTSCVYPSSPFSKLLQTFCRINADHTAVHSWFPCGSPSSPSLDSLNLLMLSLSNHQGSWHLLNTCNLQELPNTWSELNTHETVLCRAETRVRRSCPGPPAGGHLYEPHPSQENVDQMPREDEMCEDSLLPVHCQSPSLEGNLNEGEDLVCLLHSFLQST